MDNASRSQMPLQQPDCCHLHYCREYMRRSVDMLVHPVALMACFTRRLLQVYTRFMYVQICRGCVALRLSGRYVVCKVARWTHMGQMDSHGTDVMWHLPACHRQMGLSKLIDSAATFCVTHIPSGARSVSIKAFTRECQQALVLACGSVSPSD